MGMYAEEFGVNVQSDTCNFEISSWQLYRQRGMERDKEWELVGAEGDFVAEEPVVDQIFSIATVWRIDEGKWYISANSIAKYHLPLHGAHSRRFPCLLSSRGCKTYTASCSLHKIGP